MLGNKLTIRDVDVKDKRVLIRVDFNVPIQNGVVTDSKRVKAAIPTLKYCLDQGAKSIVLLSHLGRPDGDKKAEFSLAPVAKVLETELGTPVTFHNDCLGLTQKLSNPTKGSVHLLENVRFYVEEEGKGVQNGEKIKATKEAVDKFCKELTTYGDVYINDAFGTAHRAHASMVGIQLPQRASGFLMEKEVSAFAKLLDAPERPFLAILGGAKVEDKIKLIDSLMDIANEIIICGGMSYTFLKHLGKEIGTSLYDEKGAAIVQGLLDKAKEKNIKLHFPIDYNVVSKFGDSEKGTIVDVIPADKMSLDHGPKTIELFNEVIQRAKTVIMNGPAGVFEIDQFAVGTKAILQKVQDCTQKGTQVSVIGGGDSASAAKKFGFKGYTLVSTGGGASLELLELYPKKILLPGLAALSDKNAKL
jgi:phosphoglycerate kinase